jgi:bifunctional pyridoxal-dependent enzyme with beta-cystathionase and maltose regulon repressor activities
MLADIAARHGIFLISDETYREIVFEGPRDMSTLKLDAVAEQTIVVDSVSKRFSATGHASAALPAATRTSWKACCASPRLVSQPQPSSSAPWRRCCATHGPTATSWLRSTVAGAM